jgi:hypothetical protein
MVILCRIRSRSDPDRIRLGVSTVTAMSENYRFLLSRQNCHKARQQTKFKHSFHQRENKYSQTKKIFDILNLIYLKWIQIYTLTWTWGKTTRLICWDNRGFEMTGKPGYQGRVIRLSFFKLASTFQ